MILIAARSANNCIGKDNALPWKHAADMAWFRQQTVNQTVCMGRNTFESIGKPLPNRRNIVVSTTLEEGDGYEVVRNLCDVPPCICIGGQQLYAQLMPVATKIWLTTFDFDVDGDAWFPSLSGWEPVWTRSIEGGLIQEWIPTDARILVAG